MKYYFFRLTTVNVDYSTCIITRGKNPFEAWEEALNEIKRKDTDKKEWVIDEMKEV